MGDTPAPCRSNCGQHPTPKDPMNAADPLFPDPPSDFESQQRSESARKGWEKCQGNRKNSATTPVNMSPAGSPQVSSTLLVYIHDYISHLVQGKEFKQE